MMIQKYHFKELKINKIIKNIKILLNYKGAKMKKGTGTFFLKKWQIKKQNYQKITNCNVFKFLL